MSSELTYVCDVCGKVDKIGVAKKAWTKVKITGILPHVDNRYKEKDLCPICSKKVMACLKGDGNGS